MQRRRVAESRFESVDEQPRLDVDVFRRRRDRMQRQEGARVGRQDGRQLPGRQMLAEGEGRAIDDAEPGDRNVRHHAGVVGHEATLERKLGRLTVAASHHVAIGELAVDEPGVGAERPSLNRDAKPTREFPVTRVSESRPRRLRPRGRCRVGDGSRGCSLGEARRA